MLYYAAFCVIREGFYTPMAAKGQEPFDTWNAPLDDGSYLYEE